MVPTQPGDCARLSALALQRHGLTLVQPLTCRTTWAARRTGMWEAITVFPTTKNRLQRWLTIQPNCCPAVRFTTTYSRESIFVTLVLLLFFSRQTSHFYSFLPQTACYSFLIATHFDAQQRFCQRYCHPWSDVTRGQLNNPTITAPLRRTLAGHTIPEQRWTRCVV